MKKSIYFSILLGCSSAYANNASFNVCINENQKCYNLTINNLPVQGSIESYTGTTTVDPNLYKIVAYSFTDAWYTKPWTSQPDIPINEDGSFSFTIITGGYAPQNASSVAISIVPKDFVAPILEGAPKLPAELFLKSLISIDVQR